MIEEPSGVRRINTRRGLLKGTVGIALLLISFLLPASSQTTDSAEAKPRERGFAPWFAQLPPPSPGTGLYRARAQEVMDGIQAQYWNPETSRYSKEPGSEEPEMVWGSGIMFSAVVGAARHDAPRYRPLLQKFFTGLDAYWDAKMSIPGYEPAPTSGGGKDKYYDDNAWLVLTFLEAYELTGSPEFLSRAGETLAFVLSGWDDTLGGGIWWHEAHEQKSKGKNTCANAPTAVACLRLAKFSSPERAAELIAMARKIVAWTVANLQESDGLFADAIHLDGTWNHAKLTYNSGLMLRAFLELYHLDRDPKHLDEAKRIAKAADALIRRRSGVYRDSAKWSHLLVEADLALYRVTREEYLLERARANADFYYMLWQNRRPKELIVAASFARTLWLLADTETEEGKSFWAKSDQPSAKAKSAD